MTDLNPGQGLCDAYMNPPGIYKCSFLKYLLSVLLLDRLKFTGHQ